MILDFNKPGMDLILDPNRRIDLVVLVDVTGGVMNGDPDNGARSRVDPVTGQGIMTDVAAKRIIRDNSQHLLAKGLEAVHGKMPGSDLYVSHRGVLNLNHELVYRECKVSGSQAIEAALSVAEAAEVVPGGKKPVALPDGFTIRRGTKDAKDQKADPGWVLAYDGTLDAEGRQAALTEFGAIGKLARKAAERLVKGAKQRTVDDTTLEKLTAKLCELYFDVRTFGAVATTGDSCGAVRGPWQFVQGTSIDPLDDPTQAIVRVAVTKVEDMVKKRQEMGRRNPTPYALYRFHAFYNPLYASRTRYTVQDMKLFWSSLVNFGLEHRSSLRGQIEPAGVYAFVHDNPLGRAHAHELFDRVAVLRNEGIAPSAARSFNDYRVAVMKASLPEGVTLVTPYQRPPRLSEAAFREILATEDAEAAAAE